MLTHNHPRQPLGHNTLRSASCCYVPSATSPDCLSWVVSKNPSSAVQHPCQVMSAQEAFVFNAKQIIVRAYFICLNLIQTVSRDATGKLATRAAAKMQDYQRLWPGVVEYVRAVESLLTSKTPAARSPRNLVKNRKRKQALLLLPVSAEQGRRSLKGITS
jgi:hypothetical protein